MSYGIESYGEEAYGGAEVDLAVDRAKPVSVNSVRVYLTKEPQNISAQLVGDVLNPRTWKVTREDTGVGFTVLAVSSFESKLVWDVRVLEPFASSNITHRVSAATLLDLNGVTVSPNNTTFLGIATPADLSLDRKMAGQGFAIRDLANPQAVLMGAAGGVYRIGTDGDYTLHQGPDFIRKQIFRRLMTSPGGFVFLPNFGVGLRVKEPIPTGDLLTLQKQISDQVKLEPEVDAVRVSLAQAANQLTVVVQARLKTTGQNVSVPITVPFGGSL